MDDKELKYDDFINIKDENPDVKTSLTDELNKISDKVDLDSNNDYDTNNQNNFEEQSSNVNIDANENNDNNIKEEKKSKVKDPLTSMMGTNLLIIVIIILFIIAFAKAYTTSIANIKIGNNSSVSKEKNKLNINDKISGNKKSKLNFEKMALIGEPVLIIDEAERVFFVDGRVYDYDMNLIKTLTPNRKYTHYNIAGNFIYMDNKGLADEPISNFTIYDAYFNPIVKNVKDFEMRINPNILIVKLANGTRLYTFDIKNYREYPQGYKILDIKNGNDIFKYIIEYEVNGIKCIDIFDRYLNLRPEIAALSNFDKLALVYKTGFEIGEGKRYSGNKDIYYTVREAYENRAKFAGAMNGNKSGKAYFFEDKVLILLITKDNKYQICKSDLSPLKLFKEEVTINEEIGRVFVKNGEIYDFDMNLLKKVYDNKKLSPIVVNYQVKDDYGYVMNRTRVYYTDDKDMNGNNIKEFNLYDADFNVILDKISNVKLEEGKGIEVTKDGKTKMYSFDIRADLIKGK